MEAAAARIRELAGMKQTWGLRWLAVALAAAATAGCVREPMGEFFCPQTARSCECNGDRDRGAVVVRWRVNDAQVGRLRPRGECCCNPDPDPISPKARAQCGTFGSDCLDSPAWLIRNVQLRITSLDKSFDCVVTAPCSNGELTTEYCLAPGAYDLQLYADVEKLDTTRPKAEQEFVCAQRPAASPPAVRRMVQPGRAVNLDGIVLSVNGSTVVNLQDASVADAGVVDASTD